MGFLKKLWDASFVEVKIDKRFLFVVLALYGLNLLKHYYERKGAELMYDYLQQQMNAPKAAPDGEPAPVGSSWESNI